jgi:hypothetical protein
VFMSDGGENVRRVQEYLHPFSEHLGLTSRNGKNRTLVRRETAQRVKGESPQQ